jgi:hypothetical protein
LPILHNNAAGNKHNELYLVKKLAILTDIDLKYRLNVLANKVNYKGTLRKAYYPNNIAISLQFQKNLVKAILEYIP